MLEHRDVLSALEKGQGGNPWSILEVFKPEGGPGDQKARLPPN